MSGYRSAGSEFVFVPNRFEIMEFSDNQIARDVRVNNEFRLEVGRYTLNQKNN